MTRNRRARVRAWLTEGAVSEMRRVTRTLSRTRHMYYSPGHRHARTHARTQSHTHYRQALLEHLLASFRDETGLDAARDPFAVDRLRREARTAHRAAPAGAAPRFRQISPARGC